MLLVPNVQDAEIDRDGFDGFAVQHTLRAPIHCTGIGVHGGLPVTLRLVPAPENTGIVFRRVDLDPVSDIPARFDRVTDTRLCTLLTSEDGRASVGTVEHLMAALAGCQIDNALVEIDGPEVPIMDGSAEPFVFLIECAGIAAQSARRKAIRILKPVMVRDGDKIASFQPALEFSLSLEIDFASRAIGRQQRSASFGAFRNELSRARTFGFVADVEALRAAGLGRGGSLDNAILIDGDTVLNPEGTRYEDEFVRHKMLDAVGDLSLAGYPILGKFVGSRSGHAMNNRLLHSLFASQENWALVDMPEPPTLSSMAEPAPYPRQVAAVAF
jgi:UDP-3-O-[3-hydroxymyristoyl] N-acetylglucosamine deacetylase